MSRADGIVSETYQKLAYGETLTAAQQASARADLGAYQAELLAMAPSIRAPRIMASPPTVTTASSAQIATPMIYPAASGNGTFSVPTPSAEHFSFYRGTSTTPSSQAVGFNNVTNNNVPAYGGVSFALGFVYTGTDLELVFLATNTGFLIKVDDEYVSMTPVSTGASGDIFVRITFAQASTRRIDIIGYNLSFKELRCSPTDTVVAARLRGPKCIVLGDSFTATQPLGWTTHFADAMGWDDCWASGVGGTGYLATLGNTAPSFRQRVLRDVIGFSPDVVFIFGSLNDYGNAAVATIGTEADLLYSQIKTALPNCLLLTGVNNSGGVQRLSTDALNYRKAIRDKTAEYEGLFLDIIEMPVVSAAMQSTTTQGAYAANRDGQSIGISTPLRLIPGATYEIEGTERIYITSSTQTGPTSYTSYFFGNTKYAHANAASVIQVGGALMTGAGRVGATTGKGNADLFLSNDDVHWSPLGYQALGYSLASLLKLQFQKTSGISK